MKEDILSEASVNSALNQNGFIMTKQYATVGEVACFFGTPCGTIRCIISVHRALLISYGMRRFTYNDIKANPELVNASSVNTNGLMGLSNFVVFRIALLLRENEKAKQIKKTFYTVCGVPIIDKEFLQDGDKKFVRDEVVYFVSSGDKIKIGYSSTFEERLTALRLGSPLPVVVLFSCLGNRQLEKQLHYKFREFRSHGEWFYDVPDLHDYIDYWKSKGKVSIDTMLDITLRVYW